MLDQLDCWEGVQWAVGGREALQQTESGSSVGFHAAGDVEPRTGIQDKDSLTSAGLEDCRPLAYEVEQKQAARTGNRNLDP